MTSAPPSALSTQSGATNPASLDAQAASPPGSARKSGWLVLALLLFFGALVHLPALRTPLLLDDYLHASMIEGTFPVKRSPFELYDFINDRDRDRLVERGLLPWWSHPELKVRFFRPLSSALRFADHRAFGDKPLLLHLHSFAWWVLAVLAARSLFRRVVSETAATIAVFAFALAPCHALPLAWLANREALVSLVFGSAGLACHVRFREEGSKKHALLAALLFGLAMLSGEYAISFGGYVLAIELLRRKDPWIRRLAGMAPFVVPAIVYLGVRRSLDYGTFASGFYTDPFRETLPFLRSAPRRLVTLILDGWFSLDDDTLDPGTPAWMLAAMALVAAPLVALTMKRALAALDEDRRRRVGFMLLGSLLSLPPVLAVVPSPRVLGASLLGVTAAVGTLLEFVWFQKDPSDARKAGDAGTQIAGFVALALGFSQLVHGPMTAFLIGRRFQKTAVDFLAHAAPMKEHVASKPDLDLLVVRTSASAFFLPFALDLKDKPNPRWRILAQTGHVLFLRRGPKSFDLVAPPGQSLFPLTHGQLFRSVDARFATGDVIRLPRMRVTILDAGQSGPRSARFELDTDLDAAELTWISENSEGFTPTSLPAVGFGKPFDP